MHICTHITAEPVHVTLFYHHSWHGALPVSLAVVPALPMTLLAAA